ncbi:predicted protein [Chaetoceros tenuissimus]|uniref:Uncharacterized protein n=1 Tax=Chaetoceros tenuissimus TaxID=426638 RepID=A0AAD3CG92_9STRA|nr:predicted protein [Chaetoceros tenuissimus]
MKSTQFPLIGEQANSCKFPPTCNVYIVDDSGLVIGSGTVSTCFMQVSPSLQVLYEVETKQIRGFKKELVSEEHLRFQNGTRVLYQKEEAVVLGMCCLPPNRLDMSNQNRRYWYTIELEPATGIIHDVDQDDLAFLKDLDRRQNVAVDTNSNNVPASRSPDKDTKTRECSTPMLCKPVSEQEESSQDHFVTVRKEKADASSFPVSLSPLTHEQEECSTVSTSSRAKRIGENTFECEGDIASTKKVRVSSSDSKENKHISMNTASDSEEMEQSPCETSECFREWTIVNGEVFFWCMQCNDGKGFWTNHREKDHDITQERHAIFYSFSRKDITPSSIASMFEEVGQVFFNEYDEFGSYGVMLLDQDALKKAKSMQQSNKNRYDLHIWVSTPHYEAQPSQLIENHDYHKGIFKTFHNDLEDALNRNAFSPIPVSSWVDAQMCLRYHISGRCHHDCPFFEDHRECDEKKISELLTWSKNNLQRSFCGPLCNQDYKTDMFVNYKGEMKILTSKSRPDTPRSKWYGGNMCAYWHIKGSCFGDCHRLDDHRACDDEKLEELLSWCKHNEEGVPQSGINPNYMGEVFSPYKNGLKGALGKKGNRERVPSVYGTVQKKRTSTMVSRSHARSNKIGIYCLSLRCLV